MQLASVSKLLTCTAYSLLAVDTSEVDSAKAALINCASGAGSISCYSTRERRGRNPSSIRWCRDHLGLHPGRSSHHDHAHAG